MVQPGKAELDRNNSPVGGPVSTFFPAGLQPCQRAKLLGGGVICFQTVWLRGSSVIYRVLFVLADSGFQSCLGRISAQRRRRFRRGRPTSLQEDLHHGLLAVAAKYSPADGSHSQGPSCGLPLVIHPHCAHFPHPRKTPHAVETHCATSSAQDIHQADTSAPHKAHTDNSQPTHTTYVQGTYIPTTQTS